MAFLCLGAVVGAMLTEWHKPYQLPKLLADRELEVHGIVCESSPGVDDVTLILEADRIGLLRPVYPVRLLVKLKNCREQPLSGTELNCTGFLYLPAGADNELERRNYTAQQLIENDASGKLTVQKNNCQVIRQTQNWRGCCEGYRNRIIDWLYNSSMRPETADMLLGLLCGDATFMHPEVRENYRGTGVAHILALSGYHVGIIAAIVSLITLPLFYISLWTRRLQAVVIVAASWFFVAVTGFSVSAVRAAALLTAMVFSGMFRGFPNYINSLILVCAAMLAVCPAWIYSISFQLSFAAVLGLLIMADECNPISNRKQAARRLYAMLSVPVIAMLATGMISVYYFRSLPLYFLPANLLVACTAPVMIGGGAASVLLGLCGIEWAWLHQLLDIAVNFTNDGVGWFSKRSYATINELYISPWLVWAWYIALGLMVYALYRRTWRPLVISASILCFGVALNSLTRVPNHNAGELYIPADRFELKLIGHSGNQPWIYSGAGIGKAQNTYLHANDYYGDWLHRNCYNDFYLLDSGFPADSAIQAIGTAEPLMSPRNKSTLRMCRNIVLAGGKSIALIRSNSDVHKLKVDYVMLCAGRRKVDVKRVVKLMQPSAVLLAPNLSEKRLRKFLAQLDSVQVPKLHNIADSAFYLKW